MRCPTCATESPDDHRFCPMCGSVLAKPIDLRDRALDAGRGAIWTAIARRAFTDEVLLTLWAILPLLISLVLGVPGGVLFVIGLNETDFDGTGTFEPSSMVLLGLATIIIGSIIAESLYAILAFKLVRRQNEHYARERDLRAGVLALLDAAANTPHKKAAVMPEMSQMTWLHNTVEERRDPVLWGLVPASSAIIVALVGVALLAMIGEEWVAGFLVIMVFAGLLGLVVFVLTMYMFYFLGKNMYEHDGRWNAFATYARSALTKLGFPPGTPFALRRLPERSFIIYLIVTIFIGIFIYYWWYALVKDPNEHFRAQWSFEDSLVHSIGQPPR